MSCAAFDVIRLAMGARVHSRVYPDFVPAISGYWKGLHIFSAIPRKTPSLEGGWGIISVDRCLNYRICKVDGAAAEIKLRQ